MLRAVSAGLWRPLTATQSTGLAVLSTGLAGSGASTGAATRSMQSYHRFPRRIRRDMKRRKVFAEHELETNMLKALAYNRVLPLAERKKAMKALDRLPRDSRRTRIHDFCMYTGRSRAVLNEFGMSRMAFRYFADKGQIPGVRRSSW